jgi:putative ABC transport system permease protein
MIFWAFINSVLRIVRKNKLDFFLNLIGLSVAMVVFIFITLYVENEATFDNYHPDGKRIFRLTTTITSPNGEQTKMALANPPFSYILQKECPEIEELACVDIGGEYIITYQKNEFKKINIRSVTPSFFNLFYTKAIEGNSKDFLKSPNTIILTKSLAKKIFQDGNPIGKMLVINKTNYEVTGVIENIPSNTDLKFSALIRSDIEKSEQLVDWGDYFVYFKTNSGDIGNLKQKIKTISDARYDELLKKMGGFQLDYVLQPLQSIHFDNSLLADTPKGNKTMVYVFSIIALLILVIAGINYNNLTLAQLEKRDKEFFIRNTMGCGKRWIFYHLIWESLLNVILAVVVSVLFFTLLINRFNTLFDKNFDIISIAGIALPLLGIFIVFGILTGLYPAFITTRTSARRSRGLGLFGKSLVTFQNAVTIIMIAGLLVIWNQVKFMKNAELGFDKEKLLIIEMPREPEKFPGKEVLRQEFSALPEIQMLALGGGGTILGATDYWMKAIIVTKDESGKDIQFVANQPRIDENYIDLFGIELKTGRNFSSTISGDAEKSVIINEAYAGVMGWKDPIGKFIDENQQEKVIGVVKDFHFDALNNPIEPLMFRMLSDQPSYLFIKTDPKNLQVIQKKWENIYHGEPFEYRFMDQHFAGLYKKDEKQMVIFSLLTFMAILISCLGLYGLASHFIANRTKEIGIRKVNGAKVYEVISLLNKGFVGWVIIAFFMAAPVAWFAMHRWLENFAYKTTLSWWIFALAGALALATALLTVSFQSWRAATRNPVESLRYE